VNVVVVAERRRGQVLPVTYELVSAAAALEGRVAVAALLPEQQEFESDLAQAALERLLEQRAPDVVLLAFGADACSYAPAVAAKLGLGFASDVFALRRDGDELVATRAFDGGAVHAELAFPRGRPVLLLLRPAAWPRAAWDGRLETQAEVGHVRSRARHVAFREAPAEGDALTEARLVLAIGRGIGEREHIALFERVAQKLGAELAVSRPLVEAGWMPGARQVGQSGKTVEPAVYLAFGISGAVQHVAGMQGSRTIVAVNSDPAASIFGVAHYGAVADAVAVADELDRLV
jgi:electron transfer flavoprotein alpha subunit